MDDSKLLEMAALASGEQFDMEDRNPLVRDDLALRLAVKLKITWGYVGNFCVINDGTSTIGQPIDGDPGGATRRAIVRAAASLGSLDEAGKD